VKRFLVVVVGLSTLGVGALTTAAVASVPPPTDPGAAFTLWAATSGQVVTRVACSVAEVTTCYGLDASLNTVAATMNPDGSFTAVTPAAPAATVAVVAATTTSAAVAPSGPVGTRANPVPIGAPADIGDGFTLVVNSVNLDATQQVTGENTFNDAPPDGSVYVLINVTATYNGPDDKTTPFFLISGVTSSNVEINELDNFVVAPDAFDSTADVFMGGSTTGNFVLTVPSAELDSLVLYTSAGFSDNDVYFAAH
jgi:hypothetical protein